MTTCAGWSRGRLGRIATYTTADLGRVRASGCGETLFPLPTWLACTDWGWGVVRKHRQDCRLGEEWRFHPGTFLGAFILDQIGYVQSDPRREPGLPLVIEAQGDVAGSATLLRQLTRAAAQHLPEARITYSLQAARSDHLSFALEVRSPTANRRLPTNFNAVCRRGQQQS